MKSALGLGLGISVLAIVSGCGDTAPDKGPAALPNGGSSGAGTVIPGGTTGTGGGAGVDLPPGVPLIASMGWVAVDGNSLGIQGAMFSYGDDTSKMGMTSDFTGTNACIKGTAAKVDMTCTPMAPATDCYGQFWGAAIGLNLNQPNETATDGSMMGGTPVPFNASGLRGFAFEIAGSATGQMIPSSLRFKVEDAAAGEFCTPTAKPVKLGANVFLFSELIKECWKAGGATAETVKSGIVKIAWQVVTNASGTVPFDYCVANVRALTADGSAPVATGGASTGGAASSVGGGGVSAATGGGGASSTVGGGGAGSTVGGGGATTGGSGTGGAAGGTGGAAGSGGGAG